MYNNQWSFFKLPNQEPLSSEEVRYWKNNFSKILKAGLEFEFNLPNREGSCSGKSQNCPCVLMKKSDCWTECLNKVKCKEELGDKFETNCYKQFCTGFLMACIDCEKFQLDCEICKFHINPEKDPDAIRNHLRNVLMPSQNYGRVSKFGVHNVTVDGSLLGEGSEGKGAEVITTGRRVDFMEFFKMISSIVAEATKKGAFMNERCSIHVHLLASYYDMKQVTKECLSELEKPLPHLVLANFHQLCRRYQNAITWMTSGLDKKETLTRWEKFRVSILETSPVKHMMPQIISEMAARCDKRGGKYGWVNYMFTQFNEVQDITKFHVEMRALDGILVPSAITAVVCLYYALIIKAIEISRYGLLEVGSKEWVEQTMTIKSHLMNNMSAWNDGNRFSDTRGLTAVHKDILSFEATDLIAQLKHILLKLNPAYDILEKLAYKPISIRRCEGASWQEIENAIKVSIPIESKIESALSEIIDVRRFTKCPSESDWLVKVSSFISQEEQKDISEALKFLVIKSKNDGEFIWSENLGTMLKV